MSGQTNSSYAAWLSPISAAGAFLLIIMFGVNGEQWGRIGSDPDDVMRLVQIRDWMTGQSWFHTDQYRLGPDPVIGTDMHWSRLPDVPIALLAMFFDIFMDTKQALNTAISIWPPLLGAGFVYLIGYGGARIGGRKTQIFALLLGLEFVLVSDRFKLGAIDHHNVQYLIMLAALIALVFKSDRRLQGIIAGVITALAVSIGSEVYLFYGVICAGVAMSWALLGSGYTKTAFGFGAGLAAGLFTIFIATVSPSEWMRDYCDQLSRITVLAGGLGGVGLCIGAATLSNRNLPVRIAALVVIGIIVGMTFMSQAPQCLANPLDALPTEVQTFWLAEISEARAISQSGIFWLIIYPLCLGTALVALCWLGFQVIKKQMQSYQFIWIGLLTIALALTIYQVRFYPFAHLFAILPLASMLAYIHTHGATKNHNIAYIFALLLSLPPIMALPGTLINIQTNDEAEVAKSTVCKGPELALALNELSQGLILANSDIGPTILTETQHRVVTANYHRNVDGILAEILVSKLPQDDAQQEIYDLGANYLLHCPDSPAARKYARKAPDGLSAQLGRHEVPAYLELIAGEAGPNNFQLYLIK